MKLNNPEPMPIDAFVVSRQRPAKKHMGPVKHDKLNRFLENDRKVLRFFCIWDDTDSMFGELREFVLHYHLVDDSIEVREVQKTNSGRDPFPILLRRQQLPKGLHELSETQETEKYTWKDLRIGGVLNVLGRPFLLRDCDGYTRKFYNENLNISMESMKAIPAESSAPVKPEIVYPPYNGFGTVEDSMGSCKYLVLQPPKKDFIKLLANENKVLRFVARMVTSHREDQDRRFVINYHLADDTMTIHEPPQRNAGIIGGKFMERTRVLQPGSALSDQSGPVYYDVKHLYVGGKIEVLSHSFVLLDADEYAFNFMEADPARFKYSDRNACNQKILGAIRSLDSSRLQALVDALIKCDRNLVGFVDRQALVATSKAYLPESITEHVIKI